MTLSKIQKVGIAVAFIPGLSTLSGALKYYIYSKREKCWKQQTVLDSKTAGSDFVARAAVSRYKERCQPYHALKSYGLLKEFSIVECLPLVNVIIAIFSLFTMRTLSKMSSQMPANIGREKPFDILPSEPSVSGSVNILRENTPTPTVLTSIPRGDQTRLPSPAVAIGRPTPSSKNNPIQQKQPPQKPATAKTISPAGTNSGTPLKRGKKRKGNLKTSDLTTTRTTPALFPWDVKSKPKANNPPSKRVGGSDPISNPWWVGSKPKPTGKQ